MKKLINIIFITVILSISTNANPLSNNWFRQKTKVPDKTFKISSKSKTIKMEKGQTYHMKMKLRKNRYYFISLKGKRFLGSVQCRVIVPSENNKVIFDNAAYEFDKNILFFNSYDRDVVVEIKTMPCCFENKLLKKGNIKLLFANKKIKKHENFDISSDYNIYAVN